MTGQAVDIGPWQLAVGLVFVLAAQGASLIWSLGLVRDLAIGTVRTFAQLLLMGYVLQFIFRMDIAWVTIGVFVVMTAAAAQVVHGRVKERRIPFLIPLSVSMFVSFFLVAYLVTAVVVRAEPWWRPQYFIPLAGMVIGNSMSAIAIALERLLSDLSRRRGEVEMMLSLGATPEEASRDIVRQAMRAGMIPSINSMMAVGLVFLPGMMTGQILAGADPMAAVRYQIVVMLMLAASCALGTLGVVLWVRRRSFGAAGELLLAHGRPE
ncbi:ABC transporter permease [Oceanidesulfovibrio marinus]|uniref:Iron export ABC transporter permease subunit FetB n=1 Tax=Oceanidesulfovibrio marinus TaxID=370038 RepID=A0A6P1ZDA5_9BACT|nr:iron export ABC transporter permease subunit FetB [Oceanidesulfovibrio marinus]QJT10913.1 iron export ABC transporter permease subunit FetB [Oceanidesulfovibrio marinus]TVM30825.1 iron export ABC transporter permease subunit FetB [Oceanidesulfovibrio marinus]